MEIDTAERLAKKLLSEFENSEFAKLRVATHRIKGILSDICRMPVEDDQLDAYQNLIKHLPPLLNKVIERCVKLLPGSNLPETLPSRAEIQPLEDLDNSIQRFENLLSISDLEDPETLLSLSKEFTEIINDAAEHENVFGIQHTLKEISPSIHALIHQCVEHAMPYAKDNQPPSSKDDHYKNRLFGNPPENSQNAGNKEEHKEAQKPK